MSYQKFTLGDLTVDGCKDRTPDYDQIFPEAPRAQRLLDIGCNVGFWSLKAGMDGAEVVGVDNHQPFIAEARKYQRRLGLVNVQFICTDIFNMNFAKDSFDIVLCLNLVHHFKSIEQVRQLLGMIGKWTKHLMVFEFLDTDKEWEFVTNSAGNRKIHIGPSFLKHDESMPSKVTEGRTIYKVRK